MMAAVQPGSSSTVGGDAIAQRLVSFAKRVRGLRVRRAAWLAFAQAGLVLACPMLVSLWWLPAWRLPTLVGWSAGALLWTLRGALAERRVANAALLRGGDARLSILGDELATWLEWQPRAANAGMVDWLGRTVDAELPNVPGASLQNVGRRPFGRARWLAPLVVLLLLAWWLWDRFPGLRGTPPPPPPPPAGSSSSGQGAAQPAPGGPESESPPPAPQPVPTPTPEPQKTPPPPPAPIPEPKPDEPAPPPEPPAPLLDLPAARNFVVPEHIDDGPTRRMRMHAAEVPDGPGNAASPANVAPGGEAPATPPPPREQFERAAEAAQRARHVPPEEQPMVRRFFDLLQKAAR